MSKKFKQNTRRKAAEYEKDWTKKWKDNKTFEKSVESRLKENSYVFYDGPPFLTGKPHHGHLLISTVKDTVARYQTMQGKRVERRWGWDCHGLPAEVYVEKQLGIANKKEIGDKISIPDYVNACRAAMVKTGTEWEDTVDRIGRWVEFKGAYKTMDKEYMESVWWAFNKLYDEGKIYEGEKVLVYCTKDATPISKSEVAMENSYQTVTSPSVFVFFELEDSDDEMVLAWTTTPWTLPANSAIAVSPDLEYSLVEHNSKKFYIATDAVERVMTDEKHQPLDYKVAKKVSAKELIGKNYRPLFVNRGPQAHRVLSADFVTAEDGTGIVHEAPAYGEEDYELCKKEGIPVVSIVDADGNYTEGDWVDQNIWDVNKEIAKTLVEDGRALKVEYIQHEYPHCHRCGNKLMYRAHPSWFMDIQGQKSDMLEANAKTSWVPAKLRDGRFHNILESAPDWNLSRDRYWATPLPVWRGKKDDGTDVIKVVGSYAELKELIGKELDDYHLPNVMDVEFEVDGVKLQHIGKVFDCWFESGSMPFAQFHYPFENEEVFKASFPADFIVEAVDQTRGWFNALMAVNVGLFDESPYKNLICTGFVNASDGKKMSKKLQNYTDPIELMDQFSAGSFRLLMLNSPLTHGEDFNLSDKDVGVIARKLAMIWNMYDFFTLYADVDGWEWNGKMSDPSADLTNILDKWVVSRLHETIKEVQDYMDKYDLSDATRPLLDFVDDASNWYVRRSRKRFWKSENDGDKDDAYRTLHYVLVQTAKVFAPFTPFLAEELFTQLTDKESVHLEDWSEFGHIDELLVQQMVTTRESITAGLALRAQGQLKVRQPLASATVPELPEEMAEIVKEELNVKELKFGKDVSIDTELTKELKQEGLMREVVRTVQSARKKADLKVDDRIRLSLSTESEELVAAIDIFAEEIKKETLADELNDSEEYSFSIDVKIEDSKLKVSLSKAV